MHGPWLSRFLVAGTVFSVLVWIAMLTIVATR